METFVVNRKIIKLFDKIREITQLSIDHCIKFKVGFHSSNQFNSVMKAYSTYCLINSYPLFLCSFEICEVLAFYFYFSSNTEVRKLIF